MKKTILLLTALFIGFLSYSQKKGSKSASSQKNRITNCLCSYKFTKMIGTYTFYRNGKFEYEQSNPYPLYKTGTWSYLSGNKVSIKKTWLGKSETVSIDQDCNIDWGY